ncbi:MAG: hypothetical protein JW745_09555, partial [Sedimentisphaerales bacterium]|nr:hypothetical protein [Sedimentisphaerales bacterium]
QIIALDLSTNKAAADGGSGCRFNNGKALAKAANPLSSAFHIVAVKMAQSASYSSLQYFVDSTASQTLDSLANPSNVMNLLAAGNVLALGTGIQGGNYMTSDAYAGDIAEVLIYNRQLDSQQMQQVYDYLYERYFSFVPSGSEGLIIHLDAGELSDLSDGQEVNGWQDKAVADSVNGGVYAVSGRQSPVYVANAVNGCPAVKFTGSELLASGLFNLADVGGGLTAFVVATGDLSGQPGQRVFQFGQAGGSAGNVLALDLSCDDSQADGGSGGRFNSGKALAKSANPMTADYHLIALQIGQGDSFASLKYYVDDLSARLFDNIANGSSVFSLLATGNRLSVGTGITSTGDFMSSDNYQGEIAEIMIFDTELSEQEMQVVFDDLYEKYFFSELLVSPARLVLAEGQSTSLSVMLNSQPTADVNVTLQEPAAYQQLSVDVDELVFNADNWDLPRTLTVTAIDDILLEARVHSAAMVLSCLSSDPVYDGLISQVQVSITENECGNWVDLTGDYNQDCQVDLVDISIIARYWLWCDPMKDDACTDLR